MTDRKAQFTKWLIKAWEFAVDTGRPIAGALAELVAHSDEPDYPLWEEATRKGVIGDTRIADVLRKECGVPHQTAAPTGWEAQINFSPTIWLEPKVWEDIYGKLGWVNRNSDTSYPGRSFWLWSNAANVVRFVVREKVPIPIREGED